MKKWIAAAILFAALSLLTGCSALLPQNLQTQLSTYSGVLEGKSKDAVVVKAQNGDSQLFWLSGGVSCDPEPGEQVVVAYLGDIAVENQVLQAVAISPL